MIQVEDTNNEIYHINPAHVVYVKERTGKQYKILLSNGEIVLTQNEHGAKMIIKCMLRKCKLHKVTGETI